MPQTVSARVRPSGAAAVAFGGDVASFDRAETIAGLPKATEEMARGRAETRLLPLPCTGDWERLCVPSISDQAVACRDLPRAGLKAVGPAGNPCNPRLDRVRGDAVTRADDTGLAWLGTGCEVRADTAANIEATCGAGTPPLAALALEDGTAGTRSESRAWLFNRRSSHSCFSSCCTVMPT
mmetsp:Transcript_49790/g.117075  ORF Transcript_49790/g.117075 Transcript_49790/m.117075 type:complete len:181 (-) Transcript_49790:857-1399(-)